MQTIHVPVGQRAEVILVDSIHVWLNSRSTPKFSEQFSADTRNVELDNEGYFSVRYNEKNPFTMQTPRHTTQALGVEFNVKAHHNSPLFETALIKGSIEITSPELSQSLRLKPDEIAVVNNGRLETPHISDYNYFKRGRGLFCFENESIQDLIDKLQLYYDIQIGIQRPSLLQYRCSGKSRIKDGVEHVLEVLQLKHKLTCTKDEGENLITTK